MCHTLNHSCALNIYQKMLLHYHAQIHKNCSMLQLCTKASDRMKQKYLKNVYTAVT